MTGAFREYKLPKLTQEIDKNKIGIEQNFLKLIIEDLQTHS